MYVDYRMGGGLLQNFLWISLPCILFFKHLLVHLTVSTFSQSYLSLIYFVVMCILWTWFSHKAFLQSQFFARPRKSQSTAWPVCFLLVVHVGLHLNASSSNLNTSEAPILQPRKSNVLSSQREMLVSLPFRKVLHSYSHCEITPVQPALISTVFYCTSDRTVSRLINS